MDSANKKRKSILNQVITFLTIILGAFGLWCIYSIISHRFTTHQSSTAGLDIIFFFVVGFVGCVISAILLGVSMGHELKNRKLTIISTIIFLILIVLSILFF